MRILFVSQRYHPFVGGVETQTRLVVRELTRRHQVEVAAVNFDEPDLHPRLDFFHESLLAPSHESFNDEGVPVHALTPSLADRARMMPIALRATPLLQRYRYHALRRFGYRFYRSAYLPKLRALVQKADLVHSVAGGYLGWAAQEAAAQANVPYVCTPYVHPGQHGDDADSVAAYRRADAVFALLETDRQFLTELGVPSEKVHLAGVVPLLPEHADPAAFRASLNIGDAPIVLFVGRVVAYKGVYALLDAARQVWDERPDAHFVVIGPGGDEEALNARHPHIHYLGRVSEQRKADALAACDLFCMPSTFEILPAVYLEAWSYARPVIGGTAQGLSELIEGNRAGVTVAQDREAIARCVLDLLADPERRMRMGRCGQELIRERFSKEGLVSRYEAVYQALARSPAQAPPAVLV